VKPPGVDPGSERGPGVHAHAPAVAAVERERFESYSHLVRNLHWLQAALVLLYATVAAPGKLVLYGLAAAMVAYTLALHSPLLSGLGGRRRVAVETLIDLAWVTAVIAATGSGASPLFFLYYAVLFAATPETARGVTYAKAGAATLLAIGVASRGLPAGASSPVAAAGELASGLLWPLAGLWLVAYFAAESGSVGAQLHRSLFLAAHTDPLTGLPNLRYFTALADLRGRLGQPYTIVMVDGDHLKRTNDTWGHATGSELIRRVGEALSRAARSGDDLCSRLGGDEFIVRLNGASPEGAVAYCRRVRRWLAEHPLAVPGGALPVSISVGVAAHPEHGRSLDETIARADEALYRSKELGRGVSTFWSPTADAVPIADAPDTVATVAPEPPTPVVEPPSPRPIVAVTTGG
jgi:diguanylate cyclase (GGDEF)-like protein